MNMSSQFCSYFPFFQVIYLLLQFHLYWRYLILRFLFSLFLTLTLSAYFLLTCSSTFFVFPDIRNFSLSIFKSFFGKCHEKVWKWCHSVWPFITVLKCGQQGLHPPSRHILVWPGRSLYMDWPIKIPKHSLTELSKMTLQRPVGLHATVGLRLQLWEDACFALSHINMAEATNENVRARKACQMVLKWGTIPIILDGGHQSPVDDILGKIGEQFWTVGNLPIPLKMHQRKADIRQAEALRLSKFSINVLSPVLPRLNVQCNR